MWYTVPATASNETPLWPAKEKQGKSSSSLEATKVPGNELPVYTARRVSESLPMVLKTKLPLLGACHRYHTDPTPTLFATCCGSFVSLVASTLVPNITPELPRIGWAFAKLSFIGGAKKAVIVALPVV
jgi:hypothetical protein